VQFLNRPVHAGSQATATEFELAYVLVF